MALTAVDAASAALNLSKAAWKLGSSLSNLSHTAIAVDTTITNLASEVRLLANECDLAYTELEGVVRVGDARPFAPHHVVGSLWNCLATQDDGIRQMIRELELFVASTGREIYGLDGQPERTTGLAESRDQIASFRPRVCRYTYNLSATLLLITTIFADCPPCRAERRAENRLDKLQDLIEQLQRSLGAKPQLSLPDIETTLLQCAQQIVLKVSAMDEPSLSTQSVSEDPPSATGKVRVAEWVRTLESLRRDQQVPRLGHTITSADGSPTVVSDVTGSSSPPSLQHTLLDTDAVETAVDDSDDDMEADLANAALDTGTKAFQAQDWDEADSLLQEALRLLQQLPPKKRAFCDIFVLTYRLAVCAYHTREPAVAEDALLSLTQQSTSNDEQRRYICDAVDLLSRLYLRIGQIDRARSYGEKALQARRRLLGKQSNASLESTALMAHIHFLLNNNALAKSYLAMIPEANKEAVFQTVQKSLSVQAASELSNPYLFPTTEDLGSDNRAAKQHKDSSVTPGRTEAMDRDLNSPAKHVHSIQPDPPPKRKITVFESSNLPSERIQRGGSVDSSGLPTENAYAFGVSAIPCRLTSRGLHGFCQHTQSNEADLERSTPLAATPQPPVQEKSEPRAIREGSISQEERALGSVRVMESRAMEAARRTEQPRATELSKATTQAEVTQKEYSALPNAVGATAASPGELLEGTERFERMTRKEILNNLGCQPSDRIEEAVCDGNSLVLENLLSKRKRSLSSRFRKRGHSERVTALHFAAVFGEIAIASRLLDANYNINEVPFGYSTVLTPLKFAIGARQVQMVEFLIAHGARPTELDSWASLAAQLMNRSWLKKTVSEADKEAVPNQIVAILRILLQNGWNVNAPYEASGKTVLQQAVTFWTGDYKWDLDLRVAVTSFLCDRGADPFLVSREGKSPYTLALASGHQDLVRILDRCSSKSEPAPIELPAG